MRTARINYVGASDIEYTEIRPIRPNQSVVLAGLGVTGSRLQAATKDRRYRSTQGAGYSDGLVIHSRPATRPDTGGGDWHDPPPPPTATLNEMIETRKVVQERNITL